MKEYLYNKKSIEELRADLKKENFKRVTYSFYNYVAIDQPDKFRDRPVSYTHLTLPTRDGV